MALPELTKRAVEKKLAEYCDRRIPVAVRDQVRLRFKFRGNSVTLFEERPAFRREGVRVDIVVAQFRYERETRLWRLYCADRNSRWHEYFDTDPTHDFDALLAEVDDDPTGIFWG